MSEIQNNKKLATVGYLAKVLTPIVTVIKSVETKVMNVFSLPGGGTAGQVLAKTSADDGAAEWVDISASGTLDEMPTQDSDNAVKSGGVYAALLNKQDELVGTAGQVVGFDADGHAVAQDAAATVLPVGVEGQYIGYDANGNPVAVDLPADHLTREVVDVLPAPADAVETVVYVLKVVDPDTAAVSYEEYQLVEGALVRMSGEPVDLSGYQEKLVGTETQYVGFDADGNAVAVDLPEGHLTREVIDTLLGADVASENVDYILKVVDADDPTVVTYQHWALIDGEMVLIGGEKAELPTDHLAYEVVDVLPDAADAVEGKLYVLRVVDAVAGTTTYQEYKLLDGAMIMSSADLSNVQTKLTGLENQYVGFDANGDAVAIDLPVGHLTREVVDVLPLVDDASEDILYILKVVDPDDASVTYEQWQLIEGAFAQVGGAPIELPENHLTREVVEVLPAVDDALETVVYLLKKTDPGTGDVLGYEEWQFVDGAFVNTFAPVELPENHLTREVVAALPLVDDAAETVIYLLEKTDPDTGDVLGYEEWQLVNGVFVNTYAPIELPENHLTREVVDVLPLAADASETVMYVLRVTDAGTGAVTYTEHQLIDGVMVQTSADLSGYQTKLTGTAGQMIVIDANGDAVAQDFPEGMLTREVVDVLPDVADAKENVTYILKKDDGAGTITYSEWQLIDGELVQVGGEVTDMSAYQLKLAGLENQYVGFDAAGKAIAVDLPTNHLTREVVDTLPGVDTASETVIYVLKVTDPDTGDVTDLQEWMLMDGEFKQTSGAAVDLSGKQDVLVGLEGQHVVFDADGKAVAADMPVGHLTREVVDALPAVDAASEEVIYILKTEDIDTGVITYEEYIFVDGAFVKTSNEATDLSDYQKKIVGTEGQHVVFDAAGELVAADMPVGHLTREVVDALPGVDVAAEDVVYILKITDPDTAAVTYEEWVLVDGAFVQTAGAPVDLSGKMDVVPGVEGQYIGYDVDGKPVAKDVAEIVDEAKAYTDEQINLAAHLRREIVTVDPTTLADANEHTIYMLKVDGADGADVYQEWMLIDGVMTLIGDTSTTIDLSGKQDLLTGVEGQYVGFDVDGKAVALDMPVGHMTREIVDVLPLAADAKEDVIYLLKVDDGLGNNSYEHYQLIDGEVKAIGAQIDLSGYQEKLVGTEGQLVSFDADGKAVAIDAPTDHLVMEVVDVLPTVDAAEAHKMYVLKTTDPDTAEVSYEQYQLIDGALALVGHELPDLSIYQEKLVGNAGQLVGFDADGNVTAMDVAGAAMDDVPTENSVNAVTSGGLYTALQEKQELLVGTEGQYVSFDENGEAVAVDAPAGLYTMLDQIGLTADATIDDVLSALSAGEGLFTDTGSFTNWKTMFPYQEAMDQYAYVLIIKSVYNTRNLVRWTRKDGIADAIGSFDSSDTLVGWKISYRDARDGNMRDGTICLTGSPDSLMANGESLDAYGLSNDVMTWPNGMYRFSHFTDLTNTPDDMQTGRLEHFNLKRWSGNANPFSNTWGERMSIFYASGGNVYTRYVTSGATAGVYIIDTGWRALGYINDNAASGYSVYSSQKIDEIVNAKAAINDTAASTTTTYSSTKMNNTYATISGSQALTNKTYNGYTLGAACAKGVSTAVASGDTNLITSGAVYSAIGAVPTFSLSGTTLTITTK